MRRLIGGLPYSGNQSSADRSPNSSPHKIHQHPMPKAGGLTIVLAILFINLLAGNFQSGVIRVILLASIIIFLLGLWDDTWRLSPSWKLAGQILATMIPIFTTSTFSHAGQSAFSLLSAIILGNSIGMLYFNTRPAYTFLAALAIAYTPPGLPSHPPGLCPSFSSAFLFSIPVWWSFPASDIRRQCSKPDWIILITVWYTGACPLLGPCSQCIYLPL